MQLYKQVYYCYPFRLPASLASDSRSFCSSRAFLFCSPRTKKINVEMTKTTTPRNIRERFMFRGGESLGPARSALRTVIPSLSYGSAGSFQLRNSPRTNITVKRLPLEILILSFTRQLYQ